MIRLTLTDISAQLAHLTILAITPISQGTQNQTFLIKTPQKNYYLSIVSGDSKKLEEILVFQYHLGQNNIPAAKPIRWDNHSWFKTINSQHLVLIEAVSGRHPHPITPTAAAQSAKLLSAIHTIPVQLSRNQDPLTLVQSLADSAQDFLNPTQQSRVKSILKNATALPWQSLPQAPCHLDYFPDNLLFKEETLLGIIDFFDAGQEIRAYDVAMAYTAWVFENGIFNAKIAHAFLEAYNSHNPLAPEEKAALPHLTALAAARWWLARVLREHDLLARGEIKPSQELEQVVIFCSTH